MSQPLGTQVPRTPLRRILLYAFCTLVFIYLMLPSLIVIPISFGEATYLELPPESFSLRWYQDYFGRQEWVSATITSGVVGVLVAMVSVSLGSLAAYGLVRGRFPGKTVLNALIISPIIVPMIITAVAIYKLYSDLGFLGTIPGFVLGHTIIAFPFVIIIISATLRGIDESLEQAAMSLGASRLMALRRVVFPMMLPGMVTAAVFAFLISFDELLIALFISTPTLSTLPKRLWEGIRIEINPTIAAVSTILVLLTVLALVGLLISQVYFERRRQR